jgi:hypothetical protein
LIFSPWKQWEISLALLLSSLPFGAFLSYTPHPTLGNEEQARSKKVCHGIKGDAYWDANTRLIPFAVQRMREVHHPYVDALFGGDTILVPTPGSAPRRQSDSLWVPRRICQELIIGGYGATWEPWLVRHSAVQKSALTAPGQRPSAQEHYESMAVQRRITDGRTQSAIVLVDDVLTKGATLRAGASLLAEAFPGAIVCAFALVRTMSTLDFRQIIDPVCGEILTGNEGSTYHKP